jgi:hypothetical protein
MSVLTTPVTRAPPGSLIRDFLTPNAKRKETELVTTPDGRTVTQDVNNINFRCQLRNCETLLSAGSLVDGGAKGGLAGGNMRCIEMTLAKADVPGVADNDLQDLGIRAFAALIETTEGKIVGLFAQHDADCGIGKSVHSSSQMRDFGLDMSMRSHRGTMVVSSRLLLPKDMSNL